MRSKEKLIIFLLFTMFLATGAMFYYQNYYLKSNEMKDKQYVVIAKTDIAKGATFKEGENYGVIALDKQFVFEDYILYDGVSHKKELEGKKANSAILKNEILTKGRISKEKVTENTFRLFIKPDTKSDIQKGDRINVYAQIKYKKKDDKDTMNYQTFRLLEDIIVENVTTKKNSNGADTGVMDYIEVHVAEKDVLNYHLAEYLTEQKSTIIVMEYKDVIGEIDSNVKPIEEMEGYQEQKDEFVQNQGSMKVDSSAEETNQQ